MAIIKIVFYFLKAYEKKHTLDVRVCIAEKYKK